MATIVNNPGPDRIVEREQYSDGNGGWAVAVIILIAVIAVGVYFLTRSPGNTAPQTPSSTSGPNINVTLPTPTSGGVTASSSLPASASNTPNSPY